MNQPGLPTLNESKRQRRRRMVSGKAVIGGIPPRLFLAGLLVIIVGGFLYFRSSQAELEQQRGGVMAKQRAVAKELGPRLLPLRDSLERGVARLARQPANQQLISKETNFEALFQTPGVYLRLPMKLALDLPAARKAAMDSLRDGFTSCLIRDGRAAPPYEGARCRESQQCATGELCNEYQVCSRPSSPFNARLLYRALGVLSEKWTQEVRDAGTALALVAYERGLDSVTAIDIPVAIDVYQRAKYAIVVLDEEPAEGLPPHVDADKLETEMERLQRTPHFARVGVLGLPDGEAVALLRAEAAGELRDVGRHRSRGAEADAARSRQANSCGLALSVRMALWKTAQEAEPGQGPGPSD